ncbi:MAG: Rossmann-like and DUF2520 domain-containing protein [Nitriliruptoraceae bacterium]
MSGVAIVGPGRAGTLLAASLIQAGERVVAVAGGSAASRDRFVGRFAGVRDCRNVDEAVRRAQLVVLAVPDDAVAEIADRLAVDDVLTRSHRIVHLSGALGLAPLRRARLAGASVAACHPAMTMPHDRVDPDLLAGVAWGVTADDADWAWAVDLITRLGGDAHRVPETRRALYHAALAVGSNAAAAAVATARQLLLAAEIDRPEAFLGPLVDVSVANALEHGAAALTGPVVRGDAGTISRHIAAIDADVPSLGAAYRDAMRVVLDQARLVLDADAAATLEAALDAPGATRDGGDMR